MRSIPWAMNGDARHASGGEARYSDTDRGVEKTDGGRRANIDFEKGTVSARKLSCLSVCPYIFITSDWARGVANGLLLQRFVSAEPCLYVCAYILIISELVVYFGQ